MVFVKLLNMMKLYRFCSDRGGRARGVSHKWNSRTPCLTTSFVVCCPHVCNRSLGDMTGRHSGQKAKLFPASDTTEGCRDFGCRKNYIFTEAPELVRIQPKNTVSLKVVLPNIGTTVMLPSPQGTKTKVLSQCADIYCSTTATQVWCCLNN